MLAAPFAAPTVLHDASYLPAVMIRQCPSSTYVILRLVLSGSRQLWQRGIRRRGTETVVGGFASHQDIRWRDAAAAAASANFVFLLRILEAVKGLKCDA
jgi:hypothetical protein